MIRRVFTVRYGLNDLDMIEVKFRIRAVPELRQLVAGLSPRRRGFDPRSFGMRFEVDKVALGQVFLHILQFPPVSIIPPVILTRLLIHVVLTGRTNGPSLGTSQNAILFRKSGSIG